MSGKEIKVKTGNFTYRVLIENYLLHNLGKAMRLLFPSDKLLLVSDTNVFSLYGEPLLKSLKAAKWQTDVLQIRPGESSKTLDEAARIYDAAVDAQLDRNSPIIALGGGVVGDLAGFSAATYLRGVPLVMVPTSLLAQVDSSIGGKVAVNHPRGKNIIGSIYPPRIVFVDPSLLTTLPAMQFEAGLAEVIKYGIIESDKFFFWLEENLEDLLKMDSMILAEAIEMALRAKARVVEEDEYERDYRRVLNFGHTIGHALESATDFKYYLHGEAVLIGMAAAVKIALQLKLIDHDSAGRIDKLLNRLKQKKAPEGLTADKVIDKLRQDKKRRDGNTVFVLPTAIGSAAMLSVNDEKLLADIINRYLR